MKNKKIGVALGGGAARGFAHLGVLKIFEKYNITPALIAGTSMGAIVGAAFASGKYDSVHSLIYKFKEIIDSDEFEKLGLNVVEKKKDKSFIDKLKNTYVKFNFYRKMLNNTNIFDNKQFEKLLKQIIPDINIEDTKIPFKTVTLNIKTGKKVVLEKGSLIKAVMASCAIPGIFKPVSYKKMLLIDGGWAEKVPASVIRKSGIPFVIAVDVSQKTTIPSIKNHNGLEILFSSDEITSDILTELQLLAADIVIHPEFKKADWYDVSRIDEFIKLGQLEAEKKLKYFHYSAKYNNIISNFKILLKRIIK